MFLKKIHISENTNWLIWKNKIIAFYARAYCYRIVIDVLKPLIKPNKIKQFLYLFSETMYNRCGQRRVEQFFIYFPL